MAELSGLSALGRALLHLERASATGIVHVTTRHEQATLSVIQGRVCAVEGVEVGGDDSLGHHLIREGAFDAQAHAQALATVGPQRPVGAWLVAHDVASAPAVAHGLRCQVRGRLLQLLKRARADYDFKPQALRHRDMEFLAECAPRSSEVVLTALRSVASTLSADAFSSGFPVGPLALTGSGHQLVDEGALWPEEQALRALLKRGATWEECQARLRGMPRALRLLQGLALLEVVRGRRVSEEGYSRLLRKRRQLQLGADPFTLLEVPNGSSPQRVRRALRRLALEMHPDRVGAENAQMHAISSEVMRGLLLAEEKIRASSRVGAA